MGEEETKDIENQEEENFVDDPFLDARIDDVRNEDPYEFKKSIKDIMAQKILHKSTEYIKSGSAFDDFVKSDRFNESKQHLDNNDVALNLYKKYKGDVSKIKAYLKKNNTDLSDVAEIMDKVKKLNK